MLKILEVVAIVLVALAMSLALAHALELPGKLRLSKERYLAVQPIYYPGFAIGGGIGEAGGVVALFALLFLTPPGTVFWLTLGALLALLAMHAAYWVLTHPVNNFWLKDFELKGLGFSFFSFDPLNRPRRASGPDWKALRDRWEYSHVVRAVLGLVSLVLLASALVV
jgi:hypothetical protein